MEYTGNRKTSIPPIHNAQQKYQEMAHQITINVSQKSQLIILYKQTRIKDTKYQQKRT